MQKFEPQGRKMLVSLIDKKNFVTGGGIEVVQREVVEGEVVEVSKEYSEAYKKGDIIAFSSGAGISQMYNGKPCLWIDAKAAPDGDVWFIVKEDK